MGHRSKSHRLARALRLQAEQAELDAIAAMHLQASRRRFARNSAEDHAKANAMNDARKHRINSARGLHCEPVDMARIKRDHKAKASMLERRKRKLAGVIKWDNGMPTLRYARAGFGWANGEYVKLSPRATGIVQTFGASRADERADAHDEAHPQPKEQGFDKPRSARSKAKQAARERFAVRKAESLERVRAEKERQRIARQHRKVRMMAAAANA